MTNDDILLVEPDASHERAYMSAMDSWEALETVQPELLRRDGAEYRQVLKWCGLYKTDPDMLSTGVTCALYFLVDKSGELLGGMVINHDDTRRGHLHAGIAPWHRNKGLGTGMLRLALEKCREMGMKYVHIVPHKDNIAAIRTIIKNGGVLADEFCDNGRWSQRYRIAL